VSVSGHWCSVEGGGGSFKASGLVFCGDLWFWSFGCDGEQKQQKEVLDALL